MANACWGQEDLSQALIYAQRALTLNRSLLSSDDQQVAANLAILANIYHHAGDDIRALELAKQALATLENSSQSDFSSLVTVLNNIGAIQFSAGLFDMHYRHSFV
ncbi:MAG: tetratricopeptide repeat protein [Hydrococcus sp. SU_1_0]|nr:tetratricopeptide repeat protein [Hydrococcus sp. SU_1_0]